MIYNINIFIIQSNIYVLAYVGYNNSLYSSSTTK